MNDLTPDASTHPLLWALYAATHALEANPDYDHLEVTYELDPDGASSTTVVLHRPVHASQQP